MEGERKGSEGRKLAKGFRPGVRQVERGAVGLRKRERTALRCVDPGTEVGNVCERLVVAGLDWTGE